jgi:hypothetical protein
VIASVTPGILPSALMNIGGIIDVVDLILIQNIVIL